MDKRSVPFFSLKQNVEQVKHETLKVFEEILDSQQFIGGRYIADFEKKLATYLDVSHAISCNSGTDGLWLALKALDLKKDSIVLTSDFSFIASSSEIVAHGAHPVFIDVDPTNYNIDIDTLQKWLEDNAEKKDGQTVHKTTGQLIQGIVAVDLFGQCNDYTRLRAVAREWNLWIVEDACQSIGAEIDGKKAGTFGDIGVFSFYPTKNLGAFGDGGAVVTSDPELAERLMKLKNHGRSTHYHYEFLGINSRMDTLQAAVLSIKLDHLDGFNARRREIAARYNDAFSKIGCIAIPEQQVGTHVYHQYCIQVAGEHKVELRKQLIEHLKQHNVGFNIFYPQSFKQIDFLNTSDELKTECPISKELTQTILALPVWPELSDQDVAYVCDVIQSFCQPRAETLCSVSRFYGGDL